MTMKLQVRAPARPADVAGFAPPFPACIGGRNLGRPGRASVFISQRALQDR